MSRIDELETTLHASHARLDAAAGSLTAEQVSAGSYCRDWSIAQVLSHIGSGAAIFRLLLDAGLNNADAPGREAFEPIWDVWNAMSPEEQQQSALIADAAFLEHVDSIPADRLESLQMTLFGTPADAARLLSMRLNEHAIHTWDIVVMSDPAATLPEDAVAQMVDGLGPLAARSGKTDGTPLEVTMITTDPERTFRLSVADAVSLAPADPDGTTATVTLPAEALIRLVYGRLDPDHTPAEVSVSGVDLNALRAVFQGF